MDILNKRTFYAIIVLFFLYGVLLLLLVQKSVKTNENSLKIDRIELQYKYELEKYQDEAEKSLSENKKAYYEHLYEN